VTAKLLLNVFERIFLVPQPPGELFPRASPQKGPASGPLSTFHGFEEKRLLFTRGQLQKRGHRGFGIRIHLQTHWDGHAGPTQL
jgi:hypothetical protein